MFVDTDRGEIQLAKVERAQATTDRRVRLFLANGEIAVARSVDWTLAKAHHILGPR